MGSQDTSLNSALLGEQPLGCTSQVRAGQWAPSVSLKLPK